MFGPEMADSEIALLGVTAFVPCIMFGLFAMTIHGIPRIDGRPSVQPAREWQEGAGGG